MGLDTSHDCWHGSYSSFHRWRCMIAQEAGLPPLGLMEGFYEFKIEDLVGVPPWLHAMARSATQNIPIPWFCLKDSALHELLNHMVS